MRIDELITSATESNGLVGKTLFGLQVGAEYGIEIKGTKYVGTFYGIENNMFILRSGTKTTETATIPCERAEISLGSRRNFYRV